MAVDSCPVAFARRAMPPTRTSKRCLPAIKVRPVMPRRKRVTSTVVTELSITPSIGRESHQRGVGSTQIE